MRGELVSRDAVEAVLAPKIIAAAQYLQSIPDRLSAIIAAEPSAETRRRLLMDEFARVLEMLAVDFEAPHLSSEQLMGWRLRRSVQVIPGVRLNFSKSGVSTTIGGRGLHTTYGRGRARTTVGVPGTGLSYTSTRSTRSATSSSGRGNPLFGMLLLAVAAACYAGRSPIAGTIFVIFGAGSLLAPACSRASRDVYRVPRRHRRPPKRR